MDISMSVYLNESINSMEWSVSALGDNTISANQVSMVGLEKSIARRVNKEYFEDLCGSEKSWFMTWVNKYCPATMGSSKCKLTGLNKNQCDTACSLDEGEPWTVDDCCPDELQCDFNSGKEENPDSCPFHQCRKPMLEWIIKTVSPGVGWMGVFSYFLVVMIVLTGLLICYNPRDDLQHELLKTGVIVENTKMRSKHPPKRPKRSSTADQHRHENARRTSKSPQRRDTRTGPRRTQV